MSKVKTITTVAPVKVAGMEVGSIMQDKDGYFYRAKGISGPHDWRKDNDHRSTIDAVKSDLPPGATIPQVKAPQANQGKGGDAKTSAAKPAPQAAQDKPQASPQAPAKASQEGHKGESPNPKTIHALASGAKPVAPGGLSQDQQKSWFERLGSAYPGKVTKDQAPESKVRYKLVEAMGETGAQYWLYPGYTRAQGFKWESLGGFMFLTLEAVGEFLKLNGIALTEAPETVDIRNGSYNPNKGVTPNDDPNGQRNLL